MSLTLFVIHGSQYLKEYLVMTGTVRNINCRLLVLEFLFVCTALLLLLAGLCR